MIFALLARLATGDVADALSLDGEKLALVSPRAFAPGQPVAVEVALGDGSGALALEGKSLGSKRRDDGRFDVQLRLVSLRREARERLALALGSG